MKKVNESIQTQEVKKESILTKLGRFLNSNAGLICCIFILGIMLSTNVYATTADTLWTKVTTEIQNWVTRLGGVVMFIGGIMFGLGWKSDDAEQKSRGVSTIIAGAIVAAIAAMTSTFFK